MAFTKRHTPGINPTVLLFKSWSQASAGVDRIPLVA